MGNDTITDDVKKNLTYINFCLLLFKEIEDFFLFFFEKRIKQFYLSPKAKDYQSNNTKYAELKKTNKTKSFYLYIEDILNLTLILILYLRY